ncbi:MAG TPA: M28 family peptidase [Anaerolineaceae bacterium]|nr:M28 family peptidase [Anaerolineaceae bacterium]
MKKLSILLTVFVVFLLLLTILPLVGQKNDLTQEPGEFSGDQAYNYVFYQQQLGPRVPGSEAHAKLVTYLETTLTEMQWQVIIQPFTINGSEFKNVIATRQGGNDWYIIAAHYDSRELADRDPDPELRNQPVPGANDGASGTAVLLELARTLPKDLSATVSLVFFDGEDQGGINKQDWILGSTYYASQLDKYPNAVILLDMVGDEDQKFYYEANSNQELRQALWLVADDLGYGEYFEKSVRHSILDDHVPFVNLGIPAVDIIDFDYEYWHTTNDTARYVSPSSLERVGNVVYTWLLNQNNQKEASDIHD